MLKHKSLKVSRVLQIPFSEKEVVQVLDQVQCDEGFESVRNKAIVDLLYSTGMRRAELIGLKVADVDFSNNVLKVLGKRSKERIVPLLPVVKQELLAYGQERSLLIDVLDPDYFFLTKKGLKLNNSLVYRLMLVPS